MRRSISVTDAMRNFADYINRVVYRGERFTLLRGGRPVAELSPVPTGMRLGDLPGLLESLPRLSKGDGEAFARELAAARQQLSRGPLDDPWAS